MSRRRVELQKKLPPGRAVGLLLVKAILLGMPILLLVTQYLVCDPFHVLYHHDPFTPRFSASVIFNPNRDFVSSERFLWGYRGRGYDSFVMGSSRSLAYPTQLWQRYLPSSARPFHFDAYTESLFGVWTKLEFMNRHDVPIRNLLLIVDRELLETSTDFNDIRFNKDPAISGTSELAFQSQFLSHYFAPSSILSYASVHWPWLRRHWTSPDSTMSETIPTNDLSFGFEERIKSEGEHYWDRYRKPLAQLRTPGVGEPVIGPRQRQMLADIREIIRRHHTSFRIIISPLVDQIKLNPRDLSYLQAAFGIGNVFDFSGVNKYTRDYHSYGDLSHYRETVADEILRRVYGPPATASDLH